MVFIILWMVGFSLLHSLTADKRVKEWVGTIFSERVRHGWYRLFYNVISVVTLAPVFIYAALYAQSLYTVPAPFALAFRLIQVIGAIGVMVSILQIDWLRFAGFRQAWAFLHRDTLPLPDEALTTTGVYRWVRHPLYFFSLLVLWFTPTMTDIGLVFNIAATVYFVLGSIVEEKRMVAAYGDTYVAYQRDVPWMIPLVL